VPTVEPLSVPGAPRSDGASGVAWRVWSAAVLGSLALGVFAGGA
jgi:hypothetical protein